MLEKTKLIDSEKEQINRCLRLELGWEGTDYQEAGGIFRVMKMFCVLIRISIIFVKTH